MNDGRVAVAAASDVNDLSQNRQDGLSYGRSSVVYKY